MTFRFWKLSLSRLELEGEQGHHEAARVTVQVMSVAELQRQQWGCTVVTLSPQLKGPAI